MYTCIRRPALQGQPAATANQRNESKKCPQKWNNGRKRDAIIIG